MKKILKKIVDGDSEYCAGTKVLVWYENDWHQSKLTLIDYKLYVILPNMVVLYPNPANPAEIYVIENVEEDQEIEKKPRVFSVNWSAKYETELTLEPGQSLEDAIGDIDPSPGVPLNPNHDSQYISDSFEVNYVKEGNKKIAECDWTEIYN